MNLIEKLGLEKCKAIVGGAPEGGQGDQYIGVKSGLYYKRAGLNVFFWHRDEWCQLSNEFQAEMILIADLGTAIANHGTPTNEGTSIIDQFINSGGFDAAIQQQLQSELNNCSASNSSKNSIEDNCSDIRNHLSPLTGVTER